MKQVDSNALRMVEQVLTQGIQKALQEVLPQANPSDRSIAAQHVANLVLRLYQAGGLEAVAKEPVVEAPKMDLKQTLK